MYNNTNNIENTNNNRTTQITTNWEEGGPAPSLLVLPWHLLYS